MELCNVHPKNEDALAKMVYEVAKEFGVYVGAEKTIKRHLKRLLAVGIIESKQARPGKRGLTSRQIPLYQTTEAGKAFLEQYHSNLASAMELLEKLKPKSVFPYDP